jgi:hypothetical protein
VAAGFAGLWDLCGVAAGDATGVAPGVMMTTRVRPCHHLCFLGVGDATGLASGVASAAAEWWRWW